MYKKEITHKLVKELLNYNPNTGCFYWKEKTAKRIKIGDMAGYVKPDGYRVIRIFGYGIYAQVLAWFYMKGYWPKYECDHIDRDRDNNAWNNITSATRQQNMRNTKIYNTNKTGITGVSFIKKYNIYRAQIMVNKKQINLGSFKNKTIAVMERWKSEIENGFQNHNTASPAYLYLKKEGIL